MIVYVSFGGMIATTWVQIIKAFLLIFGASVLSFLVLKEFSFSLTNLLDAAILAHKSGIDILRPGKLVAVPVSAISLGIALPFQSNIMFLFYI